MTPILKIIVLGCLLAVAGPAAAQEKDNPTKLSDLFAPQAGSAKWVESEIVQLTYMYTAPNTCWSPGKAEMVAIDGTTMVVFLTPEIEDKICAMTLTPLDYLVTFKAPIVVETIFVQVMHPFGERIETSEILIE